MMGDTLRTDDQIYQATNQEELRRQIMSACVPKNEREHWASGEIARLERELAEARAEIERKDVLIEQMRTTLIAARNGLLIACDDNENDSRVKRFFGYIDSALAAERGDDYEIQKKADCD